MPGPTAIVTLTDVYPHLNKTAGTNDTELQGFIDAAAPVIEDMVGHVVQTTVTGEIHDGGDTSIFLRQVPVVSVTTLTEVIGIVPYTLTLQPVGAPVDNYGYTLDSAASGYVVRRGAGSVPFPFYPNHGNISVTYVAGRATVPSNVRLATLELIRHWYQWGQQGTRPAFGAPADEGMSFTPSGFAVPNRVKQLCGPSYRTLAFA